MPSHRDPRSYVKQVPLPIGSQKGLRIQARGDVVYNPTLPTRKDVREDNYSRRAMQMNQQGFRSVPHKPYQGIGDPFYLDQKKLILHALGQWDAVFILKLFHLMFIYSWQNEILTSDPLYVLNCYPHLIGFVVTKAVMVCNGVDVLWRIIYLHRIICHNIKWLDG